MINTSEVSKAIRAAGFRVRSSAPRSVQTMRVTQEQDGRVKVVADFTNTRYAVLRAELVAGELEGAGWTVDVQENTTFFYVTGKAGE